jgi:hypothetical protein
MTHTTTAKGERLAAIPQQNKIHGKVSLSFLLAQTKTQLNIQ